MTTVKIYGLGWVGKAMKALFPESWVYDPALGLINTDIADICFVCVPTPLKDGKLDISIVEDVVANAQEKLIVIRSTVNPGTCEILANKYKKEIVYQPEFLGETPNHPMLDMKTRPFLIMGGHKENTRKLINLYTTVYNANVSIRQTSLLEAEVIKLSENRAIGFKVMQLHELYEVCELAKVDYYTIRDAVYGDDPRFNLWFSFIYPNNLGFNSSKCLKKDIPAWCAFAESLGYDPKVTRILIERSVQYEKDQTK